MKKNKRISKRKQFNARTKLTAGTGQGILVSSIGDFSGDESPVGSNQVAAAERSIQDLIHV